ncbi:DUF1501 domain-containing protein [Lewinella sp. 4G2]|uniref:DUF1501 domain-containing protein n=1 Tax=Lewinella sp. 4G2 TaxID=1803372 RepID=UPI0007B47C3A|nr:DUF1501 domain-containing protein [Lewinella sp. 4G2]OAV44882.1 hypothetical protein A3850_010435 [Lewinella sp. 4G2]
MLRRKFLQRAALLPLPILLSKYKLSALTQPFMAAAADPNSDRVLVLLQLNGGNDGLNTLIPLDQYDNLAAVRSNLLLPEASLLKVSDTNAFHPSMEGVRGMYDEGKVSIIQNVGYANQNRSHFRSTDIWNTGSSAETVLTTGWLGRHLDERFPDYPAAFPTNDQPDPFAIVMGTAVSETCQGSAGNFSIAIADVDNVGQLPTFTGSPDTTTPYGRELDWLRTTIEQSNEYAGGIQDAVGAGNTMATYPEDNEVATKLRDVARLISGGLGTKIYVVELGGFDTHANQAPEGNTTGGTHADLLRTISDAVAAFQDDLRQLGLEDRVLGMTYSEFGRRIRSNASQGTDHGDAAPLFLFGGCVSGGIVGDNPEIDRDVTINEGVAMQYDFRNVYGSVLMDWFGFEQSTVSDLLTDEFNYIPVLSACRTTSINNNSSLLRQTDLSVAPNPFGDGFTVSFVTGNERARITIFDQLGRQVRTVTDQAFNAGEHQLRVDLANLPSGPYYVHLTMAGGARSTKRVIKR